VTLHAIEYFRAHGDAGLRESIQKDLTEKTAEVEELVNRNVLAKE
jgi:hypothetical protein